MNGNNTQSSRLAALVRSGRFWFGLGVSLLWLAMMGMLWLREGRRSGANLRQMGLSPEVLLVEFGGYDHWMWIDHRGERLGMNRLSINQQLNSSTDEEKQPGRAAVAHTPPGYDLSSRTRLRMRTLGLELMLDLTTDVSMNYAFELETLRARIKFAQQLAFLDAFIEDQSLYYRVSMQPGPDASDESTTTTWSQGSSPSALWASLGSPGISREVCGQSPLGGPILLNEVIMPILTRPKLLKEGQRWTTRVADPLKGRFDTEIQVTVDGRETINIDDQEIPAWRLTERLGSLTSRVWYDSNGRLLRREMDNGWTLTRTRSTEVFSLDPGYRPYPEFDPLDRDEIKSNLDPKLEGVLLEELLPGLPSLF